MTAKKASDKTMIRRLRKELADTKVLAAKYKAQGDGLEVVLREARRRTIPVRNGGGSLNFLSIGQEFIIDMDKQDTHARLHLPSGATVLTVLVSIGPGTDGVERWLPFEMLDVDEGLLEEVGHGG